MKQFFLILIASTSFLYFQKSNYYYENTKENIIEDNHLATVQEEVPTIQKKKETVSVSNEKTSIVPNTFPSTIEEIRNTNDSLGTIGRIYLPSISHSVRVFDANVTYNETYNAQTIVDNPDSVAFFPIGKKEVIGDHNYQGFSKIIHLNIGTYAYMKKANGEIDVYQMTNKFIGKNISTDITDLNGVSIQEMDSDIILYTCYTSDTIMVTLWKAI